MYLLLAMMNTYRLFLKKLRLLNHVEGHLKYSIYKIGSLTQHTLYLLQLLFMKISLTKPKERHVFSVYVMIYKSDLSLLCRSSLNLELPLRRS